jgi:hypothetical protein
MPGLRQQLFRASASIILLWVALLLPTLHFHPFFEHAHGNNEAHGHGVVHADFLEVAAVAHGHVDTVDVHDVSDDSQSAPSYQINFLTLVSRTGPFLLNASQTHCIFFFFEAPQSFRPSVYSWTFKPDHPPPIAIFDSKPGFPRSPPRSV